MQTVGNIKRVKAMLKQNKNINFETQYMKSETCALTNS